MIKKNWFLFLVFIISINVNAQINSNALGYFEDAAIYTQQKISGSARLMALGNAGTALGPDVSSMLLNPAGLGMFNRNDFSIGTGVVINQVESQYLGPTENTTYESSVGSMQINHLGMIVSSITPEDLENKKVKGGVFGIAVNRSNQFESLIHARGLNQANTYRSAVLDQMSGVPASEFEAEVAEFGSPVTLEGAFYWAYLANDAGNGNYFTMDEDAPLLQEEKVTYKGGQTQWNATYASNIEDKFYWGVDVGVQRTRMTRIKQFSEVNKSATVDSLIDWKLEETLQTRGIGIHLKTGVLYRPTSYWRVGASIQTPTVNSFKETFQYRVIANYNNIPLSSGVLTQEDITTIKSEFKYKMVSPWRMRLGTMFVLGKVGFLTADAEYVPYRSSSFRLRNSDEFVYAGYFDADNETIDNIMRNVWNINVGSELRYNKLRFRLGYQYLADPYISLDDISRNVEVYSAGVGFKFPEFSIDLVMQNRRYNSIWVPYTTGDGTEPYYKNKHQDTQVALTFTTSFF